MRYISNHAYFYVESNYWDNILNDAGRTQVMEDIKRMGNAVFVGSPKALNNISITTTSTIKNLKESKVLIFDSVSTLLKYNSFEAVMDFIIFISGQMKKLKVTFAIVCVKDETNAEVVSKLISYADKVIEI